MRSLLLLCCAFGNLSALTIQIDYTYDTNNFFDTQEKKDAIEAVAKFYGDLIQDNLLRIDPSEYSQASWTARPSNPETGSTVNIPGLIVPEDTIIVFVGARILSGNTRGVAGPGGYSSGGIVGSPWFNRIRARGQAGADFESGSSQISDVAPWGGTIAFDADTNWNFSLEANESGVEFIKIALHEMGHVLGMGTEESWDNKISGGTFTGPAAAASYGSAPPADTSHFQNPSGGGSLSSPLYGSFGTSHGNSRPVLMLGSSTDTGSNFDVITDLDLAAMVDLGWEITPPARLITNSLSPSGASFSWLSSSFCDYEVERSTNLSTFPGGSGTFVGDGSVQNWTDPSPLATTAFYRLKTDSNTSTAKAVPPSTQKKKTLLPEVYQTIEVTERVATGCYCDDPEDH